MTKYIFFVLACMHLFMTASDKKEKEEKRCYKLLPFPQTKIYGDRGNCKASFEEVNLATKDVIRRTTFNALITEKAKEDLPWILAATTVAEKNGAWARDYFDAHALNAWLDTQTHPKHPVSKLPIVMVYYFGFEQVKKQFAYIGTRAQLKSGVPRFVGLYLKASKGGDATAMNNLGYLYDVHQGRLDEAERWYKKAIKEGNVIAMTNLGRLYEEQGKLDQAIEWLTKAKDWGHTFAQIHLLHFHGTKKTELTKQEISLYKQNIEKDIDKMEKYKKKHPERWEVVEDVLHNLVEK